MALISECAMTHGNAPTTWRISDSATSEVVARAGIKLDQEVPEAPVVEAPAVEAPAVQPPVVQPPVVEAAATGASKCHHHQCQECQDQCHQVGPMMVRSQSDQ